MKKYEWMDLGSSFSPSEITAAFLWSQLEYLEQIQLRRISHWNRYFDDLKDWADFKGYHLPEIPGYATNNGHMFYFVVKTELERSTILEHLKAHNVLAVFHYLSLHKSPFYINKHDGRDLPYSDRYSKTLIRLPLFYELSEEQIAFIKKILLSF